VKTQLECTWIEVSNEVYTFVLDDQQHPQMTEIFAELKRLSRHMKNAGYLSDTKSMLHDICVEEKVSICVNTVRCWPLHLGSSAHVLILLCIFRNLWMCGDCHVAIKFISKIVKEYKTLPSL
jgi:hypothetical protein